VTTYQEQSELAGNSRFIAKRLCAGASGGGAHLRLLQGSAVGPFGGEPYHQFFCGEEFLPAPGAIPPQRAFMGRVSEIALPRDRFDFIYSLGVTTYQDPEELAANWRLLRIGWQLAGPQSSASPTSSARSCGEAGAASS